MKTLTALFIFNFISINCFFGQCRKNSLGPNEIEYVSPRQNQMLYYNFTDFIQLKNISCINRELIKSIVVKAKDNCQIEQIAAPYTPSNIFDNSSYHIRFLAYAACEITVTINDTLTKTFTFHPKIIPPPHIDVATDGGEIDFVNIVTEDNVLGDPSCGAIYWTPLKYSVCIINKGKMLYTGQNTGTAVNEGLKTAIRNAPKNSFFLFYDIELESKEGMCFKKEKHVFDDYATAKKY